MLADICTPSLTPHGLQLSARVADEIGSILADLELDRRQEFTIIMQFICICSIDRPLEIIVFPVIS